MKKNIKTLLVVFCGAFLLQGCASSTQEARNAKTPEDYCYAVGGEVKSVNSGAELYCLLPSGKVVDLKEFYNKRVSYH